MTLTHNSTFTLVVGTEICYENYTKKKYNKK